MKTGIGKESFTIEQLKNSVERTENNKTPGTKGTIET